MKPRKALEKAEIDERGDRRWWLTVVEVGQVR